MLNYKLLDEKIHKIRKMQIRKTKRTLRRSGRSYGGQADGNGQVGQVGHVGLVEPSGTTDGAMEGRQGGTEEKKLGRRNFSPPRESSGFICSDASMSNTNSMKYKARLLHKDISGRTPGRTFYWLQQELYCACRICNSGKIPTASR